MTADEALTILRDGNRRFAENRSVRPHQTPERRASLASGQNPFASILACSDSRVVPEMLFDQGLGDLFVIRIPGNAVEDSVRASLDFSVAHFHVPLIVILGHTECGAITLAVSGMIGADHPHPLMRALRPAVELSRGVPGDPVRNAAFANVRMGVDTLRRFTTLPEPFGQDRGVRIAGAVYDIDTGWVEWLKD